MRRIKWDDGGGLPSGRLSPFGKPNRATRLRPRYFQISFRQELSLEEGGQFPVESSFCVRFCKTNIPKTNNSDFRKNEIRLFPLFFQWLQNHQNRSSLASHVHIL
jgi:hypothetical protein